MKSVKVMQHLIGKTYEEIIDKIEIEEDCGDCCGWADFQIEDRVKVNSAILVDVIQISYEDEDHDRVVVNFIFDTGKGEGLILGYDLRAGSGSGWAYGATCILKYDGEAAAGAYY